IEFCAGLTSSIDGGTRPDNCIGGQRKSAVAKVGIEPSFHRIDVIVSNQLARLFPKRWILGEKDPGLQANAPRLAVISDLWRRRGRIRGKLGRTGQIIPFIKSFEYRRL